MKQPEIFEEKVQAAAEIAIDVKNTHKPNIGAYSKLYQYAFGGKPAEFKSLLKWKYFVAGVPNETSKGKLMTVLQDFAVAVKLYSQLDDLSQIQGVLSSMGVSVSFDPAKAEPTGKSSLNKFNDKWSEIYPHDSAPSDKGELLEKLLEDAMHEQGAIETLKQETEGYASDVEVNCETLGSVFKTAVGLKAKKMEGTDISETIKILEEKADQQSQAFEVLEG